MALIEIDIRDFDSDEIIAEVRNRMQSYRHNKFTPSEIKELRDILHIVNKIDIDCLNDKIKLEHISKIWNKYSVEEMESRLPE